MTLEAFKNVNCEQKSPGLSKTKLLQLLRNTSRGGYGTAAQLIRRGILSDCDH